MSKYYTPKIEEFHVGFEYEWYLEFKNNWVKSKYEATDFLDHDGICFFDDYKTRVRVKYLDQEDIDSLGFEETMGQEYYSLGEGDKQIRIESLHPSPLYRVEFGEGFLFMNIKNKSELKKIIAILAV